MKLQQLRFLVAVAQNDLNLTAAAAKVGATQPAVSKQLKLLEEELGFSLFVRNGRTFTKLTASGGQVLQHALHLLREAQNIKDVSADIRDAGRGVLSIGTTHTQARYVLPDAIRRFRTEYPRVQFHLRQGTPEQIAEMIRVEQIDFAVAAGSRDQFGRLFLLPYYQWRQRIVVPRGHPLAQVARPSLEQLAAFPLITDVFSVAGPASLYETFANAHLHADVALTAQDADVIKTYVRLGLGVGIVAEVALEPRDAEALTSIDASHLFPVQTTWVGFPRGALLRGYMYDFLQLIAPHLTRKLMERVERCHSQQEVDAHFEKIAITGRPSPGGPFLARDTRETPIAKPHNRVVTQR